MHFSILAALSLAVASVQAAGGFTCQAGPNQVGNALSYCVYDPVNSAPSSGWPTIISLPGSGSRGPASKAKELAGYDAVGKLVAQYLSGNKDSARTMAATKFLTIVPVAPDGSRHFEAANVLAILKAVQAKYSVDPSRIYVTGYSMGSRGSWRFATAYPDLVAALAPSAGGAEQSGDGTLSQEAASPVFPLLDKIVDIPTRQFAGSSDTTAGTQSPKATEAELEKLGAKDASLEILNTDHAGLSTQPWTDTDLLSWFLKQSKSGGATTPTSSVQASAKPSAVQSSMPSASPVDAPDDDEDCDDSESGEAESSEGDEEDCEEDDTGLFPTTSSSVDDEDCDDEDDTSSGSSSSSSSSDGSGSSGSETSESSDLSSPAIKTVTKFKSAAVQNADSSSSTESESTPNSSTDETTPTNPKKAAVSAKARRGWTAPASSRQHHRSVGRSRSHANAHKRRAVRFVKEIRYTRK